MEQRKECYWELKSDWEFGARDKKPDAIIVLPVEESYY